MGQYYMGVLGEVIPDHPYKDIQPFDKTKAGYKLTEMSWHGNSYVEAFAKRIYHHPMHVAWVGDYSNSSVPACPDQIYYSCWGEKANPPKMKTVHDFSWDGKFLLNHDKKVFLDLPAYEKKLKRFDSDGWVMHPLPLLTAYGNGEGGGDYFSDCDLDKIGSWAWDVLSIEDERPDDGWTEVFFTFVD